MKATLERTLAAYIAGVRYEQLPPAAIEYARKSILDTLGAAIAGSQEPGCSQLLELVRQWGGAAQATLWCHGGRVPAPLAALANGAIARAKELGDFHRRAGGVHASEYLVPAALPLAEWLGQVNGREFITAIAVGQDVMCRLGMAVGIPTTVAGRLALTRIIGPAASCARLLKLDAEQTLSALGIAYSGGLASIDMQQYADGSMTTYFHYGFCAEGSVKAALLAQRGVRGTQNFLTGRWGFFERVEPDHADLGLVTQGLGEIFEGAFLSTKRYPSCGCTHVAVDAVRELLLDHDIHAAAISKIDIGMNDADYQISALPREERYAPSNVVSARMSTPYAVATVAWKRTLDLKDYTDAAMARPEVLALMPKVVCRVDPSIDSKTGGAAIVRITTEDGRSYGKTLDQCLGHPDKPMSFDEIAEHKFRSSLAFASPPFPAAAAAQVVEAVRHLEEQPDVGAIARLLDPGHTSQQTS